MKEFAKKAAPDVLVIIGFLLLALLYFFTPLSQNLVLGGHDTVAGMGQGHEQELFHQATGETSRWTGSIFSGMPTYQISPSYGPTQLLGKVGRLFGLFTTGVLNYVFIYLLGFYLLMRSFRLKPAISALGSVLWAFSSYFFIIIAAGHIWKVNTLGFIPPTIAGLVLAYRGKYLWGALVTALFTGLQILCNHIQMTYYFLFLMGFIVVAYGVEALKLGLKPDSAAPTTGGEASAPGASDAGGRMPRPMAHWLKATAAIIVGGLLGAVINLPNLYHTWQYSHESMRGPSELSAATTADAPKAAASSGLDRDYITAWSYGIDETMTLMIPMYKGGGSGNIYDREDAQELVGFSEFNEYCATAYQAAEGQVGYLPGTDEYWGDQPMTVGPVYVGAIVCFLFFLGLFIVRGPMKWALLAGTVLSFLFAWGRHIMPFTDVLIDYLPMYNKFRTVSSALVVAEFTMPLLAILGLAEVLKNDGAVLKTRRGTAAFALSLLITAGSCLLFALVPSLADCISGQDMVVLAQFRQAGFPPEFCEGYRQAIITMHEGILASSALRSLLLIVVAAVILFCHTRFPKNVPALCVIAVLFLVSLADMWNVNRNYLNDSNFQSESVRLDGFRKTLADERILKDADPNFRVLNLADGNPFNDSSNRTAYWHKNIGGYHAAKLHRYQDLIDRYMNAECQKVYGAINTTYGAMTADSLALDIFLAQAAAEAPADADANAYAEERLYVELMDRIDTDSLMPVMNMLNAKWLIVGNGGSIALPNHRANGNAWFLTSLSYVDDANAEIAALAHLDLHRQAVADRRFESTLATLGTTTDNPGTIALDSYQPNELHYTAESKQGGIAAFSEVYYPGWTATVDGEEVPVARVNYVLRAIRIPAGKHEVVFTFRPASITITNTIAYTSLFILFVGFALLAFRGLRKKK